MYIASMPVRNKPIEFRGGSLADLRDFPAGARREAGFQLDRLQRGLDLTVATQRYRQLVKEIEV